MATSLFSNTGASPVENVGPPPSFFGGAPKPAKAPHHSFGFELEEDLVKISGLSKLNLQTLGDEQGT